MVYNYTSDWFSACEASEEQRSYAEKRQALRGCKGLDGGAQAGQASRSRLVYVKRGNVLIINGKTQTNFAYAA